MNGVMTLRDEKEVKPMRTYKEIQTLLTENKNNEKWDPKDPAGAPDFVFKSAHEKIQYKRDMMPLWKKLDLPTDFEERIKVMGGRTTKYGFDFGERERKDGDFPSKVEWHSNGQKTSEWFYKNGNFHRDGDKPAVTLWHKNGQKWSEDFYKNDNQHRDGDKPAMTLWHKNGQKFHEVYYKNGKFHRDGDKPAVTEWYENGQKSSEGFYKNGKRHRDGDKPSGIYTDGAGAIVSLDFYKNGRPYLPPEEKIVEFFKNTKLKHLMIPTINGSGFSDPKDFSIELGRYI